MTKCLGTHCYAARRASVTHRAERRAACRVVHFQWCGEVRCGAVLYCCLCRGKCAALFVNADKALARAPDGQEQWAKHGSANNKNNNNCRRGRVLQLLHIPNLAASLPHQHNCFVDIANFTLFFALCAAVGI